MYKNINLDLFQLNEVTTLSGNDKSMELARSLFPTEEGVDKEAIQVTRESIYSVSAVQEAQKITEMIIQILRQDDKNIHIDELVITDATANVGGDTLDFSKYFKSVNAVEYDSLTCGALKNNIKVYNRTNVSPILCQDYLTVYNDLHQDVLFMDPPWGSNYKKDRNMMLKLGTQPVWKIINDLKIKPWLVAVKVPSNFDMKEFKQKIVGARKVFGRKLGNHYITFVVYNPTVGLTQLYSLNLSYVDLWKALMICIDKTATEYKIEEHEVISALEKTSYEGIAIMIRELWLRIKHKS